MDNTNENRLHRQEDSSKILDDVVSSMKFGKFHVKMLILTCGAYFAACAEMLLIVFLSKPIKDEWELDDMLFPVLPFCRGLVSFGSSFLFGSLSDKFGRQRPLLLSLSLVSVFGLVGAFAPNYWVFILIRSLVSCGTSGIETIDFVLLLEFLPQKKRGCIMVIITLCGAFGAMFAAGLAWALLPRFGWRWFVGACSVPAWLILGYRLWFNYESPRYLYISGQEEKGLAVLKEISRQNRCDMFEGAIVCPPSAERGRIQDLFARDLRKQTVFTTLVWFLQSMGYWAVTMYLPEYMGTLGMDPYLTMFIVFLGEIPGLVLAMILIEPNILGRIKCFRFFSGCTVTFLLLFAFVPIETVKSICVVVVYCFMVPIYSILNTCTPEVYPTSSRSVAMALMYMVIAFPGLITAFLAASVLSTNIKWLYPTVSAAFFTLQFVFTFGLTSEPAGHGLSDTNKKSVAQNLTERREIDIQNVDSTQAVESQLLLMGTGNDDHEMKMVGDLFDSTGKPLCNGANVVNEGSKSDFESEHKSGTSGNGQMV